jgi:oxidase EvaA
MPDTATQRGLEQTAALDWLQSYRQSIDFEVRRIDFESSQEWLFDTEDMSLGHVSGRFYRICGYRGQIGDRAPVFQPLINQPETGTQGFVVRGHGRGMELLAQARTEPGNIGVVQFGPTIQATWSNYTNTHRGKSQPFLERFHHPERNGGTAVFDAVQPELGSRFLRKFNRNIIIRSPDLDDFRHPMFRWVSLDVFAELMSRDHVVNNDARLVMGLLLLVHGEELFRESVSEPGAALHRSMLSDSTEQFANQDAFSTWMSQQRSAAAVSVRQVRLTELPGWEI